jgi:hypothetical protein
MIDVPLELAPQFTAPSHKDVRSTPRRCPKADLAMRQRRNSPAPIGRSRLSASHALICSAGPTRSDGRRPVGHGVEIVSQWE